MCSVWLYNGMEAFGRYTCTVTVFNANEWYWLNNELERSDGVLLKAQSTIAVCDPLLQHSRRTAHVVYIVICWIEYVFVV